MLNKKYLTTSASILFTLATANCFADGLTLISNGISDPIKAACHDTANQTQYNLPAEMQPNSTVTAPWFLIGLTFKFNTDVVCDFILDNNSHQKIATAKLKFNSAYNSGEIASLTQYVSNQYQILTQPGLNTFTSNMTVMIEKK